MVNLKIIPGLYETILKLSLVFIQKIMSQTVYNDMGRKLDKEKSKKWVKQILI